MMTEERIRIMAKTILEIKFIDELKKDKSKTESVLHFYVPQLLNAGFTINEIFVSAFNACQYDTDKKLIINDWKRNNAKEFSDPLKEGNKEPEQANPGVFRDPKKGNKESEQVKPKQVVLALVIRYQQETGEASFFENTTEGKTKALQKIAIESNRSLKSLQQKYNLISKPENRKKTQMALNIKEAIQILENENKPKAKKLANDEFLAIHK